MPRSIRSALLVIAQFTLIALIMLSGPWWPAAPWWLLWPIAALLGGWSLLTIGPARLSIWPDPLPHTELVTHGPYHWIRHPIYTALLIGSLAALLAGGAAWRWLLWFALLAVLVVKLQLEERLLTAQIPAYQAYRQRTYRLIPFIW